MAKLPRLEGLANGATGREPYVIDWQLAVALKHRGEKVAKWIVGWNKRQGRWFSPVFEYRTGIRGKRIATNVELEWNENKGKKKTKILEAGIANGTHAICSDCGTGFVIRKTGEEYTARGDATRCVGCAIKRRRQVKTDGSEESKMKRAEEQMKDGQKGWQILNEDTFRHKCDQCKRFYTAGKKVDIGFRGTRQELDASINAGEMSAVIDGWMDDNDVDEIVESLCDMDQANDEPDMWYYSPIYEETVTELCIDCESKIKVKRSDENGSTE